MLCVPADVMRVGFIRWGVVSRKNTGFVCVDHRGEGRYANRWERAQVTWRRLPFPPEAKVCSPNESFLPLTHTHTYTRLNRISPNLVKFIWDDQLRQQREWKRSRNRELLCGRKLSSNSSSKGIRVSEQGCRNHHGQRKVLVTGEAEWHRTSANKPPTNIQREETSIQQEVISRRTTRLVLSETRKVEGGPSVEISGDDNNSPLEDGEVLS
eukprot:GHVS01005132.1.p1 GENE.GHVS01005132.1~~GHVS01005132.1.p1  ORF type:complete len:211 (-),score=41.84 GHVS01005132.1:186-818(-)